MTTESTDIFIPPRFKHIVARHVIKNLLKGDARAPLILGIHGASGEGKTFQCDLVFKEMGISAIRIAAREFESESAGEPSKLISAKYCEASDLVKDGNTVTSVLFINDLDAGIGHWGGDVQYTVNTQLVVATLMDIADFPECVNGEQTHRIPIVVTGNDFTKLYQPLTRAGRMDSHSWAPTFVEKTDIVRSNIFPALSLTDDEIAGLVYAFRQMPVSFFALVKSRLNDNYLSGIIEKDGTLAVLAAVRSNPGNESYTPQYNADLLFKTAREIASDELINHLRRK